MFFVIASQPSSRSFQFAFDGPSTIDSFMLRGYGHHESLTFGSTGHFGGTERWTYAYWRRTVPGRTFAMWRATWLKKRKKRVDLNAGSSGVTHVPSASTMGRRQFSHWHVSPVSSIRTAISSTHGGMPRDFSSTLLQNAAIISGFVSQRLQQSFSARLPPKSM